MSEFHLDYVMVQSILRKVKSIDPELAFNDELVRELTYMVDRVRRQSINNNPVLDSLKKILSTLISKMDGYYPEGIHHSDETIQEAEHYLKILK